jgi:hypothetical protein
MQFQISRNISDFAQKMFFSVQFGLGAKLRRFSTLNKHIFNGSTVKIEIGQCCYANPRAKFAGDRPVLVGNHRRKLAVPFIAQVWESWACLEFNVWN